MKRKIMMTTSRNASPEMTKRAQLLSKRWRASYIARTKQTIQSFFECAKNVYMVGKNGRDIFYAGTSADPFFFHPSMAKIRVQRLLVGEYDPLVAVANLRPGDSFIDMTLGLGADSIVASHVVGASGKVIGVEKNPYIAEIVRRGFVSWQGELPALEEAMKRIKVVTGDSLTYLQSQPANVADVVYFDPMFEQIVASSAHLEPLRRIAIQEKLTQEAVKEAQRVARRSVVLKAERGSASFRTFDFHVSRQVDSSVWYGVIHKEGDYF